jgi:hypothetical protein
MGSHRPRLMSFDGRVLVIQPDDGENMIVSLSRESDSEKNESMG